MSSITAGEALIDLLADYGVDTVFGIPGTHSIELYRGLKSGRIRHISPRHEQGGGFMADGYARASGKPGVCLVITGPGVTNLATPLGEAYMDSVPILVVSPVNPPDPDGINRGRLHELTSQQDVTGPVCAFSMTVRSPGEIPGAVSRAFDVFCSERPRPVHISIPLPVLAEAVDAGWRTEAPAGKKRAGDELVLRVADLLKASEDPVLVVGGGTVGGQQEILALAELLACPVLTTVSARGVIPGDHPFSVGAQLRARHVQEVLENADFALLLGTELAQTDHWNDALGLPARQAWVNLCPTVLERGDSAVVAEADCIDFARRLKEALPMPAAGRTERAVVRCREARRLHGRDFTPGERRHWNVLQTLVRHVPEEVTIVSDMTQIAYTAIDYLPMQRPGQWLHPTGYGTLGYGLPAAMGALISGATESALAIVGDAGIQYTMQEMSLASELGLNLVVLLWNNDALQQICDDMDNAGVARIGVVQKNPDFVALARACDWTAWQVRHYGELGQDIDRALALSGPCLLRLDECIVPAEPEA